MPHGLSLSWVYSFLLAFLDRYFIVSFSKFWSLHCIFDFTLTDSHIALLGMPPGILLHTTPFEACVGDCMTPAFFVIVESASCG